MTTPNNRSTTDNPAGLYRHVEFDGDGYLRWAVSEIVLDHVVVTGNTGTVVVLTKQEAAKLAGHLLQASDADDLTAVGDDK